MSPPLVVLRANDVCFLGILRACARADVPVVPVVYDWPGAGPWFSDRSRHLRDAQLIPNPAEDPEGAVAALADLGRRLADRHGRKLMIIPSSDTNLMLLQNHFEPLNPYFLQMGTPGWDRPRLDVIAKDGFAVVMAAHGIPIPQTLPCNGVQDIERVVNAIRLPCVYKPSVKDYSQSFQNTHDRRKAVECTTREELAALLPRELAAGHRLVIQEKVIFEGAGNECSCHVYADGHGDIRLASTSQKEGEIPKPYGSGTISRLTWREELLPLAERVVRATRWHGLLGIEFMRCRESGAWVVIEANFRPWLHIHLQCSFGFNHFAMLAQDAYGELSPFVETKHPAAELVAQAPLNINLRAALAALQSGDPRQDHQRLQEWLSSIDGLCTFEYLDRDDPAPGLAELAHVAAHAKGLGRTLVMLLERVAPALLLNPSDMQPPV